MADSEDIKKATEALEEYEARLERVLKAEEDRDRKMKAHLISMQEFIELEDTRSETIDRHIKTLEAEKDMLLSTETEQRRFIDSQIESLRTLKDLDREESASFEKKLEDKLDAIDSFKSKLSEKLKEATRVVGEFALAMDDGIGETLGKSIIAFKLLGIQIPSFTSEVRKAALELDTARRALIPFNSTVEKTVEVQQDLATQSLRTGIPITELGDALAKASTNFRMLSLATPDAQAKVAAFSAQMRQMGVEGAASVLESLVTDQGLNSIEDAIEVFGGLTSKMQQLGVLPSTLKSDFDKLIPTFSMFGDAAMMNIAQVSLAAAKAKIDVGSITGFADNFSGYGDAARAAQTINAIFGKSVIRNPAELVRTFYTSGPAGVLQLVKQKIIESGIDLDEAFAGPAGAAKLRLMGGLGFGSAQAAERALTGPDFTEEETELFNRGIMPGTPEAAAAKRGFDDTARATIPVEKQLDQITESLAVKFLEKMSLNLGTLGPAMDKLMRDLSAATFDTMAGLPNLPDLKTMLNLNAEKVKETLSGGEKTATVMPKSPTDIKDFFEATSGLEDSLGGSTEATRDLITATSELKETMDKVKAGMEGSAAPSGGDTQTVKLVLQDGTEFNAHIVKTAHDGINKMYTRNQFA